MLSLPQWGHRPQFSSFITPPPLLNTDGETTSCKVDTSGGQTIVSTNVFPCRVPAFQTSSGRGRAEVHANTRNQVELFVCLTTQRFCHRVLSRTNRYTPSASER